MNITIFFAGIAAGLLANGLTIVYVYCLWAMDKAQKQNKHPSWGVIGGAALAPIIAAGSLYFFVIP